MSCFAPVCNLNFNHVYGQIFQVNGVPVTVNMTELINHIRCAIDKFTSITGDLPTEIRSQFNKIITETSNATKEVIYIVFGGLLLLLVLLVLTIYAAIYWRNTPYVVAATFALSLFFIIVVTIVIIFWVYSIYNTTSTNINLFITNINQFLATIGVALLPAYCCFGNVDCGCGAPCSCSITSSI